MDVEIASYERRRGIHPVRGFTHRQSSISLGTIILASLRTDFRPIKNRNIFIYINGGKPRQDLIKDTPDRLKWREIEFAIRSRRSRDRQTRDPEARDAYKRAANIYRAAKIKGRAERVCRAYFHCRWRATAEKKRVLADGGASAE